MLSEGQQKTEPSVLEQVLASALKLLNRRQKDNIILASPVRSEPGPAVGWLLDQCFRRLGFIDWTISRYCSRRKTRPRMIDFLRLAVCEILYQDSLPGPVIVDSCVRLARVQFSQREAGFVNAFLRHLLKDRPALLAVPSSSLPPAARYNVGIELLEKWRKYLPGNEIERLTGLAGQPPPVLIRGCGQNPDAGAVGMDVITPLPPFPWAGQEIFFHCLRPRTFFAAGWADSGLFYVQDPATALAVALMQVVPGETIVDLCAAPGGKSLMIHERLAGTGYLLSCDRDRRRLQRLTDNLPSERDDLSVLLADAASPPLVRASCDGVLVDVPCSNTGVLRRRPEVKWRFTQNRFKRLLALQGSILAGAAAVIAPGGRLVYSTCSIEPEENGDQIRMFLRRHDWFRLEEERQLMPGEWHDGAYAARLRRRNR